MNLLCVNDSRINFEITFEQRPFGPWPWVKLCVGAVMYVTRCFIDTMYSTENYKMHYEHSGPLNVTASSRNDTLTTTSRWMQSWHSSLTRGVWTQLGSVRCIQHQTQCWKCVERVYNWSIAAGHERCASLDHTNTKPTQIVNERTRHVNGTGT